MPHLLIGDASLMKMQVIKRAIAPLIICMLSTSAMASENEPPSIGNFALPSSQQLGPLISLGQNIIDAKTTQLYLYADNYAGVSQRFVDIVPGVLYGITDKFSVFFNVPFAAYEQNDMRSSGIEDVFLQFEYAYYSYSTAQYSDQATVYSNISFPSGSHDSIPPTGVGSPSFLIGATYSRMYCNWYGFISPGAILTTSKNHTQFGNKYIYELGIGRNIAYKASTWILSWLLEFNGVYAEKDTIQGIINDNSGGNLITLTPSIWFSTKQFIFQLGIGFPIVQQLFGEQNKNSYLLAANIGYTFH